MPPNNWQRVEEIFGQALELPPAERPRYLARACGDDARLREQVEYLLKCDEEAGDFIAAPAVDVRQGLTTIEERVVRQRDPLAGRVIGAYRVIRELGRGGMGAVYLAERADQEFKKRVAIKLVKGGLDSDFILRRFRSERQILAALDHPNIALLLDGGTTEDGVPYFVMEYIAGQPVTRYCDDRRLTVGERLRLFLSVCSALAYAHRRTVIHRDIKPSNILVAADGIPKLLDFGIAKFLNPEFSPDTVEQTATAMRLMTPKYASPEQLRGEAATTASDIYGLGILLYELATGHYPFRLDDRPPHEVARVICEEDPDRPSTAVARVEELRENGASATLNPELVSRNRGTTPAELRQELARGLDNVILKALHKDPRKRYATVEEFAADVERFLAGLPVAAPPVQPTPRRAPRAPETDQPTLRKLVVAVLPFKLLHLSQGEGDTGAEYLGIGLADALITRLSNIRSITVRPTSSVLKFAAADTADPLVAGRELDVDYVLDGRIVKARGGIRVTVQLVSMRDGAPLWAEQFDERDTDILTLQDSISEQLARALMPHLTGEERAQLQKRGTENPAAYAAYLRGRYHWNSMAEGGFAKAINCYYEAVAHDPSFAAAHGGIADYHNWLGVYGVLPPRECFAAAREAAERAAALDPGSSEAYAALGFACHAQWEWEEAERHLRRAVELNPNNPDARQWYAFLLTSLLRFEEAERESRRALEIAPRSQTLHQAAGWMHYQARRYEDCRAENRRVFELDPNFPLALYAESRALVALGRHDEAVEPARKSAAASGGSPLMQAVLGYAYAAAGRREEARGVLAQLKELARARYVSDYHLALIHVGLGETDEAFACLEEAYRQGDAWLTWIRTETPLDPLRTDPRFASLLARVSSASRDTREAARGRGDGVGHPRPLDEDGRAVAPQSSPAPPARPSRAAESVRAAADVPGARPAATASIFSRRAVLVALVVLVAALAGLYAFLQLRPARGGAFGSVAVLPFANVNSEPDTEYLSDGITEQLINQLAQLPSLRVMARTTAFSYKGRQVDPRGAGREMGVDAVLVGRVTKRDDTLVVQAELVSVRDGARIWGETYSRKVSDLLVIQQDIAGHILDELRVRLTGNEERQLAKSYTADPEAYQLYLQGEYRRQRATALDVRRSLDYYNKSLEKDPGYSLAYVGLALAYRSLPAYGVMPPREAYPRAREAASKALEIDPSLGVAHIPLATVRFAYDWDFAGAEREYRQAIQLTQNSAEAHFAYANFLTAMTRFDEAMREYKIAQQLDPASLPIIDTMAWALYVAGKYDEAFWQCQKVLERDPNYARVHLHLGEIYEAQGRLDQSISSFLKAKELTGEPLADVGLGHAYARAGRREEALKIARDLEARAGRNEASPFLVSVVYAGLDDRDRAFEWLERAYRQRSNFMPLLKVGRRLASLQGDPRFADLLRRVGFPQ